MWAGDLGRPSHQHGVVAAIGGKRQGLEIGACAKRELQIMVSIVSQRGVYKGKTPPIVGGQTSLTIVVARELGLIR